MTTIFAKNTRTKKNNCIPVVCTIACTFIFLACSTSVMAQHTATSKKWSFLVEPYLMFPNMKGNTGVGELPDLEVDADPDDIFSNLQIGFMLYAEASVGKWTFASDMLYMSLKQDVTTGMFIRSGEVNAKQFAFEPAALYHVLPWLEAGAGLRVNSLELEANIEQSNLGGTTTARNKALSKTWVDPIVVARVKSSPGKKFVYQFRGDIGGFGIGSDFAWQVQAYAGYRFSNFFNMTAGYRILSTEYNTGSGEGRFLYDMDTFGPVLRFGFSF